MIEESYVSFEVAKLLKEKGFDVYGDGSFGSEIKIWMEYSPFGKIRDVSSSRPSIKGYPAPTLQMAMKWLREVCKLHIEPHIQTYKNYNGNIYNLDGELLLGFPGESPEQVCEAAIKYCLENLI